MQKKIIALAVAGLVSGAAYAQVAPNNVTLYGIVDMGYQYSWGADDNHDHAKKMSEMKAGGLDGSRVGVKGEEDLGNGLKAFFDATWNFDGDRAGEVKMGEGSSVGLEGSFGKIRAGYFGNFLDDNTGTDASGRHGIANTGALYDTGKYENFLAYYSPVFSGLQVKAGFSSNVGNGGTDKTPVAGPTAASGLNTRAYTAAISYENGPIKTGIAYAKYKQQDVYQSGVDTKDGSDFNAGFSYDFGVVKASVFGARVKAGTGAEPNQDLGDGSTYDKKTFWALGLAAPIGANDTVKVGYGQAKYNGVGANEDIKAKHWGVVYLHSLSKRSTIYAMYGNNDGDGTSAGSINGVYEQAINVGLRHTF